jgi:hypothetical protein
MVIGDVAVECGRVVVVDPCYLRKWKAGEFYPEVEQALNSYDEAMKLTEGEPGYGRIFDGSGIVVAVASGDGEYPVYGYFNEDGVCLKLELVLTGSAKRAFTWDDWEGAKD